jgi:hypothetical protein
MRSPRTFLWLVCSLVVACGGAREPARFSGSRAEPRVTPGAIGEIGYVPRGYKELGRVRSNCEEVGQGGHIDHAWLSDVACSEELLTAALRLKAAEVGGELLVDRRCSADSDDERTRRMCSARVARAEGAPRPLPGAAVLPPASDDAPWLESPADAWRIAVTFTPVVEKRRAQARALAEVRESPYLPASDVPVGDIIARCDGTCTPASVRESVRATAARAGADSVSEVKCVEGERGRVCTGRAGAYQADPRAVAEAR